MTVNYNLTPLTQEQREENKKKIEEKRKLLIQQSSILIQDFEDLPYWKSLASKYGIRLPAYYYPSTDIRVMRKYLKKLGINKDTLKEYLEYCGVNNLQELCSMNPTFPAYAEIGFAMEYLEDNLTALN